MEIHMDAQILFMTPCWKQSFAYDKYLPLITVRNVDQYHLPGKLFSNIYCLTQESF